MSLHIYGIALDPRRIGIPSCSFFRIICDNDVFIAGGGSAEETHCAR